MTPRMTPRGATTPASVFVWLDVIALDQNLTLNYQADIGIVKSLVKSCSEGEGVLCALSYRPVKDVAIAC